MTGLSKRASRGQLSADVKPHVTQAMDQKTPVTSKDWSNGYEAAAAEYIATRRRSNVGVEAVRNWAKALPRGATVLDLGCGHGLPISQALVDEEVRLYAIDASPTMIAAFRRHFPGVPAECGAVEDSNFFDRTFDGVLAWGLMFLLEPEVQTGLIHKVAGVLKSGGQFLFTAPQRLCEWTDMARATDLFRLVAMVIKRHCEPLV